MIYKLSEERDRGQTAYADSAYMSQEKQFDKYGVIGKTCTHGTRTKELDEKEIARNHDIAKIRCRIEHVFGFIEGCMNRFSARCIGLVRVAESIWLTSLVYNFFRREQLKRLYQL